MLELGKKLCALFFDNSKSTLEQLLQKIYDKTRNKVNYYYTLLTQLNLAEKIIEVIKKKLKKESMESKLLNMKEFE